MDDQVDGTGDHLAHDGGSQMGIGGHRQDLEPVESRARAARMQGGKAAVVAAGHGVEHVQRLLTPDLADDDSARTLPEGAALEEILERHPARPFHVRVALLEAEEILLSELVQPELGLGLEHTGSLAGRNEQRQEASHRGLPRAGGTANHRVQASPNGGVEDGYRLGRNRVLSLKILEGEKAAQLLLADRDHERLGYRRQDGGWLAFFPRGAL